MDTHPSTAPVYPPRGTWVAYTSLRRNAPIALLVLLFLALGVHYSLAIPPFESYEEPAHYLYARRIAQEGWLDPAPSETHPWQLATANRPPLYHALGATLLVSLDLQESPLLERRNPYVVVGQPSAPGDRNAVLHSGRGDEAAQREAYAVRLLRWLSLAFSAVTIVLTYVIASRVIPWRPGVALGAAGMVALSPQFLFVSASAGSLALLVMLSTLTLWAAMRLVEGTRQPIRAAAELGLWAGLAALTSSAGLWTLGLIAVAVAIHAHNRRAQLRPRGVLGPLAAALVVFAAVCGWWYLRALLGSQPLFSAQSIAPGPLPLPRLLVGLVNGFWGVFGWQNVAVDPAYYAFVGMLTALGVFGLVVRLARVYWEHRTPHRGYRRMWILLSTWAGLLAIVATVASVESGRPQSLLLMPAIAAIGIMLFSGLTGWMSQRLTVPFAVGIPLLFLAAALLLPERAIAAAYAPPTRYTLDQVPASAQDVNLSFENRVFLLGYELVGDHVHAGEGAHLRLYWLAQSKVDEDLGLRVQLYGRDGQVIGSAETKGGNGNLPTSAWVPGDVLFEEVVLPVDRGALVPVAAAVRVRVYSPTQGRHLTAFDVQGRAVGDDPAILRVGVAPSATLLPAPSHPTSANLGELVRLYGYDQPEVAWPAGKPYPVTLYWETLQAPTVDYTVFVHLLDAQGQIVAQADAQPFAGEYPTSFWHAEHKLADTHLLPIPADLPAGEYTLRVGLYLLDTGERLPLVGVEPPATAVTLGPVRVTTEEPE